MSETKPLSSEHRIGVALGIVLSLITCGFYNIYWNYRQMLALNALLGREEYNFWKWLLLSIVTCGLYHIYYEYKMGSDLLAWLRSNGRSASDHLPVIGLVLSIFGLSIICDAVYQAEINKLS